MYYINFVSVINLRGGLFSESERACAIRPWQPSNTATHHAGRPSNIGRLLGRAQRSRRRGGTHDQVVDALVRRALESRKYEEGVEAHYNEVRGRASVGNNDAIGALPLLH